MDDEGAGEESMLNRIRQLPVGEDAEDVMRSLASTHTTWKNREAVMNYLYETLEKHPEIEGLVGYSEGSAMAATFILDELSRLEKEGRPRRIKCAIFFTGWPPVSKENKLILADESDIMLDVPTLHIVGANGEASPAYEDSYFLTSSLKILIAKELCLCTTCVIRILLPCLIRARVTLFLEQGR